MTIVDIGGGDDSDGDGMPDWWEIFCGLDPDADDSGEDPDGDGLSNLVEYEYGTEPTSRDTDDDGFWDGVEIDSGTEIRPANLRWQNKDLCAVDVKIVEEQSHDSETSHTAEVVGYMLFSRTPSGSAEVIIDNGDAGTSSTLGWYVSSGANPYGDNSLFSRQAGAKYKFEAAVVGPYDVSLWWTYHESRCSTVPVEIHDGSTLLDTIEVNQ